MDRPVGALDAMGVRNHTPIAYDVPRGRWAAFPMHPK